MNNQKKFAQMYIPEEMKVTHDQALLDERVNFMIKAVNYAQWSKLKGDFAEFGVFRGFTTVNMLNVMNYEDLPRKYWAFDSFEGLPEPKGIDASFGQFEKSNFDFSLENYRETISRNTNITTDKIKLVGERADAEVVLVPGFYDQSLSAEAQRTLPDNKFALVWIDCDLYESTVPVLKYITNHLEDGALLVFDDWFCFRGKDTLGERKAVAEWLAKNPHISLIPYQGYSWHGFSFIVDIK